ncbi:MAG: TonB-dependent receptor, partial [Ketobacter sp.]|nr:TonB-dependent receptor [Ketobacter sp.]
DAVDVDLSTYADDFLGGDHEFKFGVSYGTGTAKSTISGGVNGRYYYRYVYTYDYDYYGTIYSYDYEYFYRVTADAYTYGAENETISAYIDDSWRVNDKLTINVGVRFDQVSSDIPAYPRLDRFGNETGEIIPGIDNVVEWSHFSPRIGFAYQVGKSGVLRGFYGKFYDSNVTGNWKSPPPSPPIFVYEISESRDGPWEPFYTF